MRLWFASNGLALNASWSVMTVADCAPFHCIKRVEARTRTQLDDILFAAACPQTWNSLSVAFGPQLWTFQGSSDYSRCICSTKAVVPGRLSCFWRGVKNDLTECLGNEEVVDKRRYRVALRPCVRPFPLAVAVSVHRCRCRCRCVSFCC